MICQNCQQREATVHLTRIVNGQGIQMHLCPECAQKAQGFNLNLYPGMAAHFLQALFGMNSQQLGQSVGSLNQEKCSGCGRTFSQIQKAGRMGCSHCYSEFEPQIEQLLRQIHGGVFHIGKVPARGAQMIKNKQELSQLRKKLQVLVQEERFEEAAEVRDKIRDLEKLIGGGEK
ncbi:MAG: UvrB/UvrC motif-containing protein [Desulfitobacteriia bacterium]|jgi:protein arginine kinase activator